jgi:hypothetical protein
VFDHVLRDVQGLPEGRVILSSATKYVRGEPIAVVLLTVSSAKIKKVPGRVFHVDGLPYVVPKDLPGLKVNEQGGLHKVNNFYLQPVESG